MEAKQFYTTISSRYNEETFGGSKSTRAFARTVRTEAVIEMIDRRMKPGGVIADVGCGPAQYAEPLLERGFSYHGIDIAEEMYAPAKRRLAGVATARFSVGSIEAIPLGDASVEGALVVGVIEYLGSDERSFSELYRILKPGGILILTFPNLLNPLHALRTVMRPLVAPILRRISRNPAISDTVFVSNITYRVFRPNAVIADLERRGFKVLDHWCHGYDVYPRDRPLSPRQLAAKIRWESACARIAPSLGSNYILCLQKG